MQRWKAQTERISKIYRHFGPKCTSLTGHSS
jgi:hypothetical protein